ncbi:GNAT family N-acetyltransferase [Arthrobacter tecti]
MTDVEIRSAAVTDACGIARVHVRSWQEAYAHLASVDELAALDVGQRAKRWVDIINDDRTKIWTARVESEIVGWIAVGDGRDDDGPRPTEVEGIYVVAEHYGTGVGQHLLNAGIGTAPAYLWMAADNPRARAFYERNGFVPDGAAAMHNIVGTSVEIVRLVR